MTYNKLNVVQPLVQRYLKLHKKAKKSDVVAHFKELGYCQSFIYRMMQRVYLKLPPKNIKGSGRKRQKTDEKTFRRIKCMINNKIGKSCRKLGVQLNLSKSYTNRLIRKCNLKHYKQRVAPNSDEKKQIDRKLKCGRLYDTFVTRKNHHEFILDDETYFDINPTQSHYYTRDKSTAPDSVKFCKVKKFPEKVLVWLAISRNGISKPYFMKSKGAMNMQIYSKYCISRRLSKFIKKLHYNDKFIFWPDNASSHYGSVTLKTLKKLNIPYIPKSHNPVNVPQLRPIERFWAILKRNVYANGYCARNLKQLKKRVSAKIAEFSPDDIRNLFHNFESNIRKAYFDGPDSILK
ncbi:uncharacterized protein B4U80_05270 [Leptotrombidium deliense]|uniref:Tc1-like transposase DDE domain-containing protein n=1 Tax=Leptotrombidium deliense TaxID=299467 RepID=A0A443RZ87_9ACAR|nr:uncharacterized protein B4U80_05270 [Leptotrombidium deliense]